MSTGVRFRNTRHWNNKLSVISVTEGRGIYIQYQYCIYIYIYDRKVVLGAAGKKKKGRVRFDQFFLPYM